MRTKSRLLTGLAAILSVIAPQRALSDVIIKTVLPQSTMVADGSTVYTLEVRANTMQYPGTQFNGADWDVSIPSYFTVIGAELPDPTAPQGPSTNPNDFFYPQMPQFDGMMFDNNVHPGPYPFVGGGDLYSNHRSTDNIFTGPSDLNDKLLGKYFVRVNLGTTSQTGNFDLNEVQFLDTTFTTIYSSPDIGSGVTVQNQPYTIVAPDLPGDINNDGLRNATDVQLFTNVLLGTETNPTYRTRADMNHDGNNNGLDTQVFVNAYTGN